MAVLPDADRLDATRKLIQRMFVQARATATFDLTTLKAAADATDDWIDSNAANYNASLPPAFRNNATPAQKTLLFCFVALKRAGLL